MSPTKSGCAMTNAVNLGAFVQATILDPATGKLSVYDPLVITKGITPAVPPSVPRLPADAVVTIDFGFNGTDLFQVGATPTTRKDAHCTDGPAGSVFGQVSFCNGRAFFAAVTAAELAHKLTVPSVGTSSAMTVTGGALGTGDACPVTRNFEVVDQDPSDNVTTEYLLNPATGQTVQDTASNAGNAGNVAGATLLYRAQIGQPPVDAATNAASSPAMYCRNMIDVQTPFLAANRALLATGQPPVVTVGDNLLTFLANRLSMSFTNLACQKFGFTNPVTVTLNGAGAAIAAAFNTRPQQPRTSTAAMPAQGQRKGRAHHTLMNPSGM